MERSTGPPTKLGTVRQNGVRSLSVYYPVRSCTIIVTNANVLTGEIHAGAAGAAPDRRLGEGNGGNRGIEARSG
jgi:hypothetical protein